MLKDDAKDQIPLFDIPAPERTADTPPASPTIPEVTGVKLQGRETAAPEKRPTRTLTGAGRAPRSGPKKVKAVRPSPGPVPKGDVRLTANIREDLHLKLKIVSATRRTTIGELIEDLVDRYL